MSRMLVAVGFVVVAVSIARGDDRQKALDIDSWGRPSSIGKSDNPQYFVWQDEQGWHVHTDTGGKRHEFNILIETVGGRVLNLTNISGLENKKKKRGDGGKLSADNRTIKATFRTGNKTDGVDFTVDNNTSLVRFRLLVNGEERPKMIALGAGGTSPDSAAFTLAKKKK